MHYLPSCCYVTSVSDSTENLLYKHLHVDKNRNSNRFGHQPEGAGCQLCMCELPLQTNLLKLTTLHP